MRRAPKVDATQRAIEFSIPAVPVSRNRLDQHWALLAKEDARWRDLVNLSAPNGGIRGPVLVTLTFYAPRPCDPDNLARQVLNALKPRLAKVGGCVVETHAGLIDDDDWRTVVELRLRSRKGEARTTVRIEAAEAVTSSG